MPLVTSSPGVRSTTCWASATNTDGTEGYRPWTSSTTPNATIAPTTPAIPALNLPLTTHSPVSRLDEIPLFVYHFATRPSLDSFIRLYTYYYGCAGGPGSSAS